MRAVPRLCKFYPGICLTTEEKARKNLSQGKKNLSQVKKTSVRVQYTNYQNTHTGGERDIQVDWLWENANAVNKTFH